MLFRSQDSLVFDLAEARVELANAKSEISQATVNMMRGTGLVGQGAHGKLQYSPLNFNFYLPSLTTIKSYLSPEKLMFGISDASIKQLAATVRAAGGQISKLFCVSFDEVSVKEGAVVRGDKIIGFISGEVKVEDAAHAKEHDTLVNICINSMIS